MVRIDDYTEERECIYKGEHYSVRDNGTILRHHRAGMRRRKLDEKWTFGYINISSGYMEYGGERIHRIVATAFHGEAPTENHVVDHIDTNRQNNRPENLRWLTRLENALNNPITAQKIVMICGSLDAFKNNPQLLYGHEIDDKNFSWMKTVTPEEAKNSLENWKRWAETVKPDPNYKKAEHKVGDWIFKEPQIRDPFPVPYTYPNTSINNELNSSDKDTPVDFRNPINTQVQEEIQTRDKDEEYDGISDSLTPNAKQRYWGTPTEFPCCPSEVTEGGLEVYMENLKEGVLFTSNKYDSYYVIDKAIIPEKKDLIVLCTNNKDGMYSHALCSVKLEKGFFVHMSIKRFSNKDVASRYFKLIIGEEEWTTEDAIWWDT